MKTFYNIIGLYLLVFSSLVFGREIIKYEHSQSKVISRSFPVNSDAKLVVNNKYGNIKVEHWNRNQIDIEVRIEVSARDQQMAVKRLNDIEVKFSNSKSEVSATTEISSSSGRNISFEIHYLVKIPTNAKVQLSNHYGDILGDNFTNETYFSVKYGSLSLGSLKHKTNRILMQYSKNSSIQNINEAAVNADYSDLSLDKANKLNMVFKYADALINDVDDLALEMQYGDLNLKQVNSLILTGNYSDFVIGNVKTLLSFAGNYGNMNVAKMMAGFNTLVLKCNYFKANIGIDSNAGYSFVSNSNYGDVSLPSGLTITSSTKSRNSYSYVGSKGSAKGTVSLSFNYGSIKFN